MKTKIPYGHHNLDAKDKNAVLNVLSSDWLTQGPTVPNFEARISEYCEVNHAIAMTNATSALFSACSALEIESGDIVWISAISFVASANAPLLCGAKVEFVDVNVNSVNICIEKLTAKLEYAERKGILPKLLIVVHMGGASTNMHEINILKKKYNFRVLEDASHAIGGEYNNRKIGSCEFSDACVFSFHPVKIITTGEGGAVTTKSSKIAQKLYNIRSHGIIKSDPKETMNEDGELWNYRQVSMGFNFRMTDFQAALGLSQFDKLDNFISQRNELANEYHNKLVNLPISFQTILDNSKSSYHLFVIIMPKENAFNRNALFKHLLANNIQVNLHYNPIYLQPFYKNIGFKKGYCINAEIYAKSAITLPLYPGITSEQRNWIVEKLYEFFR